MVESYDAQTDPVLDIQFARLHFLAPRTYAFDAPSPRKDVQRTYQAINFPNLCQAADAPATYFAVDRTISAVSLACRRLRG